MDSDPKIHLLARRRDQLVAQVFARNDKLVETRQTPVERPVADKHVANTDEFSRLLVAVERLLEETHHRLAIKPSLHRLRGVVGRPQKEQHRPNPKLKFTADVRNDAQMHGVREVPFHDRQPRVADVHREPETALVHSRSVGNGDIVGDVEPLAVDVHALLVETQLLEQVPTRRYLATPEKLHEFHRGVCLASSAHGRALL